MFPPCLNINQHIITRRLLSFSVLDLQFVRPIYTQLSPTFGFRFHVGHICINLSLCLGSVGPLTLTLLLLYPNPILRLALARASRPVTQVPAILSASPVIPLFFPLRSVQHSAFSILRDLGINSLAHTHHARTPTRPQPVYSLPSYSFIQPPRHQPLGTNSSRWPPLVFTCNIWKVSL